MEEMTPEQKKALADAKAILNINIDQSKVESTKPYKIDVAKVNKAISQIVLEQRQAKLN